MNETLATEGRIENGSAGSSAFDESGYAEPLDPADVIASALEWVEKNQTLAMLGAFAVGVFVGVLLRD